MSQNNDKERQDREEEPEEHLDVQDHELDSGNFLALRERFISPNASDKDVEEAQGFEYVREIRSHGQIVACLPFRRKNRYTGSVSDTTEFLLRREIVPPWDTKSQICSITGGYESDLGPPVETMREEMIEETGYEVPIDEFISLGQCRATKAADTVYHLFTVDLTGQERKYTDPEGDGSLLESYGSVTWLESVSAPGHPIEDPHVQVMRLRMMEQDIV